MHVAQIRAVLGGERRHILRDFAHHPRIGFDRDVTSAEMLGQSDDAERDRHPRLDPRRRVLFGGVALDPDQLGRAAADIEQDGAPPLYVEQRRATDHGQRRFGLAIDHLEPDAGLARDAGAKAVGIGGGAAGLGCDQPQAAGLAIADFIAADAERRDGAVDRRLADRAGCRNAFAEPDDPRKRIHHAKTVASRTGDQKPAIIGAKVERGINTVCRGRRNRP